jgi:hypothetical protein
MHKFTAEGIITVRDGRSLESMNRDGGLETVPVASVGPSITESRLVDWDHDVRRTGKEPYGTLRTAFNVGYLSRFT